MHKQLHCLYEPCHSVRFGLKDQAFYEAEVAIWCSFCPALNLNRFRVFAVEQVVWWQHRMKASCICIVQPFTNAGQKHLKSRVAPWFTNPARCLHLSTFFVAHSGYNFSHEQRVHVENVLQIADGVEQCIALLCTIVYCSEPTKPYWDTVCLKTLSPGVASRILVTQATAAALLSCRNATCGFKIAEPTVDQEIQQRLWRAFGICAAQLTFQKQGAWSRHHKSYKSARACKCNLPCCCLTAINAHLAATGSEG